MADYKQMYLALFDMTSKAIEEIEKCESSLHWAAKYLKDGQQLSEYLFIKTEEEINGVNEASKTQ